MDISTLDLQQITGQGAPMDVLHPGTGEPMGGQLLLLGFDSEAVETAARDTARQLLAASEKPDQADFLRHLRVARAKAAVAGVIGGSGATQDVASVCSLLEQPGFAWLVDQITEFSGDRASFFKNAETA